MNPEHAKAFNELRELCGRYDLTIEVTIDHNAVQFLFKDRYYFEYQFNKDSEPETLGYFDIVNTPPPRNKR